MYTHIDPDEYETVFKSTTCPFHETNPGVPHAGCCCSVSMEGRQRPRDEVLRIKAERQRQHEDAILAEAECIRARRTGT